MARNVVNPRSKTRHFCSIELAVARSAAANMARRFCRAFVMNMKSDSWNLDEAKLTESGVVFCARILVRGFEDPRDK